MDDGNGRHGNRCLARSLPLLTTPTRRRPLRRISGDLRVINLDVHGHNIMVDGVSTFFIDVGTGKPIVLIHGGGAGADSWGNWKDVIPALGDGFRVIAVDMLGFGHTGKPNGDFVYSQQARIRHMAAFLKALDLDAPLVVGNSMGGATALGIAVEHPELIGKLILMGSAGLNTQVHEDLKPVIHYDFTRDGMVRLVRALTTDAFVIDDALIDYRFSLATDPDTRRAYAAAMAWIREQNGLFYPEAYIRQNRVPTLVVNGKNDKVVPVSNAYKFLDLIEQSSGYIMPYCGHWAMIEHPVAFARITRDFALTAA